MSTPEDPSRGESVRVPAESPPADETGRQSVDAGIRLAECVADLQRVKAEYDNYRKRVRRDRVALQEIAVANVLRGLLPALDAIEQAREHGEVTGGFRSVVEVLETRLSALGLQAFGEPGEPFDPTRHEALVHERSGQAGRPLCTRILRAGYRVGGHLLRPAQVAVTEPPCAAPSALPAPPGAPPDVP